MAKVLVVDDSQTVRNEVKKYLEEMKITVMEAENGSDALNILKADSSFDLVFCDVHMPVMTGIEFVKGIFEDANSKKPPIVMFTSETNETLKSEGKKYGVKGWIMKPVSKDKVKIVTQKLLNIS